QDKRISIIVRKHNGGDNLFRIRETTSVGKLMKTFCLACSHDMDSLRFIFNGARLRSTQTLQELDMADGDVVTAMFFMGGG
ncbi:ubiquitin-like protein SMT3, partial [Baffinella frigidus]